MPAFSLSYGIIFTINYNFILSALKTRNDSVEVSPAPSDAMRTRTMSIDSSALAAAERNRCKSMEFNNQKPPGYLSGGHKLPMTR